MFSFLKRDLRVTTISRKTLYLANQIDYLSNLFSELQQNGEKILFLFATTHQNYIQPAPEEWEETAYFQSVIGVLLFASAVNPRRYLH